MLYLVVVAALSFLQCTGAMKCNGMEELCDLRFDQITMAGTHNSAANKALYYGVGTRAMDCTYRNQDKSIYQQLKDGIRAFDIDVCYRHEAKYKDKKVWGCHSKAYSEPVRNVLKEFAKFLNEEANRNEVVFIRFHDADLSDYLYLKLELESIFNEENGVQMDDTKPDYPLLRDAIKTNKRVFIFISSDICNYKCREQYPYLRSVNEYHDTWDTWWSGSCYKMPAWTKDKCAGFRHAFNKPLTYVSVFGAWGACRGLVAETCNQYVKETAFNCHQERHKQGKTVNVIAVDYYTRSQSVIEIAKELNKINIKNFAKK